jgi:hypothetical protein
MPLWRADLENGLALCASPDALELKQELLF